jgi:DUF1680 family protein
VPSDLYRFAQSRVPPVSLKVNGIPVDATPESDGYVHLTRRWNTTVDSQESTANTIELRLPMPVQRVYAHENVKEDRGKVTLMRGPVVYCLEAVDHEGVDVERIVLPPTAELQTEYHSKLLGGVATVQGEARLDGGDPIQIRAIPYFAWCNRDKGSMIVWINETP